MKGLNLIDWSVILAYLSLLIFLGLYLRKRASGSLEDYFLGANKLPWWAMGISGMSSYIDMAGTMLIVSFLYMLGPRGLYIEFRGGAALILTFMLLWSGKWHYRSGCITGAEWMEFRFGKDWGGRFARLISIAAVVVTTIGMLAYLIKALGMFTSMFIPLPPSICALLMISIAAVYTIVSGFYGVVYIDIFQSFFVVSMVIFISVLAITQINEGGALAAEALKATGNPEWTHSFIKWRADMPKGYEAYEDLTLFAFFYLLRNVFFGISSSGADPRYFGARNERECGTLSFLWTSMMTVRWPMMIGFAILGIFLVNNIFPDQSTLSQVSELIRTYMPHLTKERWFDAVLGIINTPENYNPEMIAGIKRLLQDNWQEKLHLLSYEGTVNAEQIVPAVILLKIPGGIRGFIFIAFIAAALSSFNSSVNSSTAYFTRDLYQAFLRKRATNKELLLASYVFSICLIASGYLLAYNTQSINQIWGWIIMSLGGGIAIPSVLKFYWWRYNGGGFAIGALTGIVASVVQFLFFPGFPEWQQFTIISIISFTAAIIGTFLTKPADEQVVLNFYNKTRPFGFWKPYREKLPADIRTKMEREHRNDLISVPFTLGWQIMLFLLPMQLMVRSYNEFLLTMPLFLICATGMYMFWYRKLPQAENSGRTE